MESTLLIDKIHHEVTPTGERLVARVAKKELWIELEGGRLESNTEGWASFALVPALFHGQEIVLKDQLPPDALWERNRQTLLTQFQSWWGGEVRRVTGTQRPHWTQRWSLRRASRKRALFFSGGVDSFHSLHALRQKGLTPHALIWVEGFDVDHRDTERLAASLTAAREICAHHGMTLLRVRTNLRRLPFFREVNWEKTFGLALAGIGHLLRDYGQIFITSSFAVCVEIPYGSRWDIDALFSSSRHRIHPFGEGIDRLTKLAAIVDDPLVRKHLRVCWEGASQGLNCGECEKCLRTSLVLHHLGKLGCFPSFAHPVPLEERWARLTPKFAPMLETWWALDPGRLEPPLRGVLKDMFHRSLKATQSIPHDYEAILPTVRSVAAFCNFTDPLPPVEAPERSILTAHPVGDSAGGRNVADPSASA